MTPRVHETLLWLCSIPSPIGEEQAICDAVLARVTTPKLAAPVRRYENSLVVPVTRGTGGPRVCLAGHLDVVRTVHEGPARIEGDKLYGAGAADMKSGLAAMLELVETMTLSDLRCDLSLVFYAAEEGPYAENELGVVMEKDPEVSKQDFVVCLEPSDNKLGLGCNGSIHAKVTFHGRTAHSSRPWQGENAIHKAASFLVDLSALAPIEYRDSDLVYRAVTSATMASGGRGRNIVPDTFELNVNHRFTPDTTLEQAQKNVLALVGDRASVVFTDLSPSAPTWSSHPLTKLLVDAGVVSVEPKQAWTDVARFAASGVPAVNFGPGTNAQAHQRNEWTYLPLLQDGVEILRRWLLSIR
jgi:succinyl-diaminopimelate desuccinylase